MKNNLKATLLSAFALPGLGQLYKGERIKGVILIALVNVFLLCALFFVMQGAGKLLVSVQLAGYSLPQAMDELQRQSPAVRWVLGGFFLLWIYSVADALLLKDKNSL
ncbi:MAG: hypothetical protein HYS23_13820 [Geobacter sp.]|nr:hypothetical protein [Geobacter sp.]